MFYFFQTKNFRQEKKRYFWHGRSHTGGAGGGLPTWEKFPRNIVFCFWRRPLSWWFSKSSLSLSKWMFMLLESAEIYIHWVSPLPYNIRESVKTFFCLCKCRVGEWGRMEVECRYKLSLKCSNLQRRLPRRTWWKLGGWCKVLGRMCINSGNIFSQNYLQSCKNLQTVRISQC